MPTATVYTPYVAATLNGSPIAGIRKARVISSFADPVTKIYVTCYPTVTWSEGDAITVTMGSGTHNVLSATGNVYEGDYLNSGRTFELVARGPLFKAQKYKNNVDGGLSLTDLTGGPATDEAIARAVLTRAGVTYNASDIHGTGLTRGMRVPAAYIWRQGETALDYLNRLTRASLGYRMIETIGGAVQRVQVRGRPSATVDYTLQQGVDIFEGGHTQLDAFGRYTAVTVTGADPGDGSGVVSYSYPIPIPQGVNAFVYSADMVERSYENDQGGGISCANVLYDFVLPEVNRVAIRVSGVKTPRDDVFQPGQTHQVNADWLNLSNELLWCMSVTRECDGQWFTQTMEYIGGGDPITSHTPPDGKSNMLTALPPRRYPRMVDYTYTHRSDVQLIGQDAMTTGVQSTVLPPRGAQAAKRMKDYTFVHPADQILFGLDFMVPGRQATDYRRRNVIPPLAWSERAHASMLDVTNGPV